VEGTRTAPFRVLVNRQFPEKNTARMKFTRVPNYEHEGFERIVWEVAITVPHADFSKWEAYFQKPNGILIKGPSRSYWEAPDILWNPDCHDVKNKNTHPFPHDPATRKAHKATELAIESNAVIREENWWLAEIPKEKDDDTDVALDNTILSGPSDKIKKEVRKLKSVEFAGLKGLVLVWKIAEIGGIQTEKQTESFPDVQSLMDM
jgi:hypothetical protein